MTRLRSRKATTFGAVLAAFVAVLGGVSVLASGEGGRGARPLIVTAEVERRTLVDEVTLKGTVGRVERRRVDAASAGRVSAVHVADGADVAAGTSILSIDGRAAVAVPGDFPFYRPLDVGSAGNDVAQLERVLAGAGFAPGPVDERFTPETRAALAQWQAAQGYPGATPERDETVTVSLQPGSGYDIGDQSSAAVVIGPSAARPGSKRAGTKVANPELSIRAVDDIVAEGADALFEITASGTPDEDTEFTLVVAGTVGDADVLSPAVPATLPLGEWSVTVAIPTRQDDLVEADETLEVTIDDDAGYRVDDSEASTTVVSDDVPVLRLLGGGGVTEGGTSLLVISADQAPVKRTQVNLRLGGDAVAGDDFAAIDPVVILPVGARTVEIPVETLDDDTIERDERAVVSIVAGTGYAIGEIGSAVVTIDEAVGAVPVVTLRQSATSLVEGEPMPVSISLSRALDDDLELLLSFSGDAVAGADYQPPAGRVLVPAGQTALSVQVPTVADDVVEADKTLTVALAEAGTYALGLVTSATATIESDDRPEVRLLGGITTITEGGVQGFTLVADQAPVTDISIAYQVLGSATPGEDFDALAGVAILPAGATEVSVPVHAVDDDVVFQPTDMIAGAWPIRVGQVLVDEGESITAGAPLLSLTDTGLTVTLHASASDRTKLEPGQTATVKLAGGTEQTEGIIASLDETATVDDQTGEQFYEGTIDVGDFPAADGAAVTIEVILDERTDALTVPIAAVKQDGGGDDVVRVIDLARSGEITEVPVETGISEGSYIEVTSGLTGGEVVVVEVDRPAP